MRWPILVGNPKPAAPLWSQPWKLPKIFSNLEAKSTIQAWFVGKNTLLDDRSPALVVRTDPEAVRDAARQFAAYG